MSSHGGSRPDVGVVIVAAGAGVRAGPGEPKQFRLILGVPLLLRALRPFTSRPEVAHIVVVLPAPYAARPPEWLARVAGGQPDPGRKPGDAGLASGVSVVPGGVTRAQSVRAGLRALPGATGVVLVHDGVRPFVSRATIDGVIAKARAGVGAVAAVPVSDTIKEVVEGSRITRTVARERLWRAQTPQGFPRDMLERAYAALRNGDPPPSDEAALCERAGFPVEVVADSPTNFKVTTADDFRLAEALARELR